MFRIILFLLFSGTVIAQTPTLDQLLVEANTNWPTLRQRQAETLAAEARLAESQGGYGPQISFGTTYSLAVGGRSIDLPLGDLLNPVYGTLNEITQSQQFPQLENVEEQLLPNNFYDARFRIQQPLYRPEIRLNQQVKAEQVLLTRQATAITVQDLAFDVRRSYFQYLSATAAVTIYAEAEQLLTEAVRATTSLVNNGKELPLARTSLEAELARTRAEQATARTTASNALAYLNYLLGRPLDASLPADSLTTLPPVTVDGSTTDRVELAQLRTGLRLNVLQQEVEQLYFRPKVGLQLDLGSQDFDFGWKPYVLAGLSVDIPIWDNRMSRHRREALVAEGAAAQARLNQTEQVLQLQAYTLQNKYSADRLAYQSYVPAVTAAERSLYDSRRLYIEGQSNYLNLVDARTRLTRTQLEQNLSLYQAWITYAELLRTLTPQ